MFVRCAYDKIQEQDNMKANIRLFKEQGYSALKQLLRVLLLLALTPAEMAMVSSPISMDDVSAACSWCTPAWISMDVKSAASALLLMLLCGGSQI